MNTLVLVLAAGPMGDEHYSWRIPVPRHLMPIRGDPLIRRTLRLVRRQGFDAIVVTDAPHIKAVVKHTFAPAEDYLLWDTMLSTRELWDGADRIVFLQGDHIFYDDVLEKIFTAWQSTRWDCSYGPPAVTVVKKDYGLIEKELSRLKERDALHQDCMQGLGFCEDVKLGRDGMYDLDNNVIWERCVRDDPWVLDNPKPVLLFLAAGRASRLSPLSDDVPKALLEFGGLTLVERVVDEFLRYGMSEVVVSVGHHAGKIEACLGIERKGVPIRYVHNPDYAITGCGRSVELARDFIRGRKCYVIEGDQLFSPALIKLLCESPHLDCVLVDHRLEPGNDPVVGAIGHDLVEKIVYPANPAEKDFLGHMPYAVKLSEFGTEILAQFPDQDGVGSLNEIARRLPLRPQWTGSYPTSHRYCNQPGLNWAHINTAAGLAYARGVVFPRMKEAS